MILEAHEMTPTLEERVAKLEDDVKRLDSQSKNDSHTSNSLLEIRGLGADDLLFDEWVEVIAERRREIDADPNVP